MLVNKTEFDFEVLLQGKTKDFVGQVQVRRAKTRFERSREIDQCIEIFLG